MKNVDSKSVYVRLESSESIEYKRKILEILISLIQSQIISKRFDEIRKADSKISTQLKTNFRTLHEDLNKLLENLPRRAETKDKEWDESPMIKKKLGHEEISKTPEIKPGKKTDKYRIELEQIKAQLARLR